MPRSQQKHRSRAQRLRPKPAPVPSSVPAPVPAPVPVEIDGWQVAHILGKGAFTDVFGVRPLPRSGHVHLADAEPPVDYALKLLRPAFMQDAVVRQLIANEAACGREVSHPNLIAVLGSRTDHHVAYSLLPNLDGSTLRAVLDNTGYVALPHAVWFARQIADALAAMHTAGWLHSDIKPDNVLVSLEGHATVLDLGLAMRCGLPTDATLQSLRGTLRYMAPERLTSVHMASPASDVYSLGVMLFELITGQLPFPQHDPGRLAEAHLHEVPPSVRSVMPRLPREVARLVTRMLSKDPLRRPTTLGELQEELCHLEITTFHLREAG